MLNKRLTFIVGLVTRHGKLMLPSDVTAKVSELFHETGWDGFTVTGHEGFWMGEPEASLSFTVVYDSTLLPGFAPQCMAGIMATLFDQQAVLYTLETVWAELIEQPGPAL